MLRENRLLLTILAVLVALVAVPFAIDAVREALRPRLVEVRIVTATDRDPVLREGPRTVEPGEQVTVSLALRLERLGRGASWLAVSERLVLDRTEVADVAVGPWPGDRPLRVFWFTVENPRIAGELTAANAAERLSHRVFLAPEMGGGLTALGLPEHHADDSLGRRSSDQAPFDGGTSRLYARVEVVEELDDVRPLAVVTTAPADRALEPDYPALRRRGRLPEGLDPAAGELFRLPGLEPRPAEGSPADQVPVATTGLTFAELVRLRAVTSSASFAAVAATGEPDADADAREGAVPVRVDRARLLAGGRSLAWGPDVRPGDALLDGDHWMVLAEDDGDGVLGLTDRIAHCWRRPPALTRLGLALPGEVAELKLIRRDR